MIATVNHTMGPFSLRSTEPLTSLRPPVFPAHWREAVVLDGRRQCAVNQGVLQTPPSLGGTGAEEWGSPPWEGSDSGTGRKKGEGALGSFLSGAARWVLVAGYGPRLKGPRAKAAGNLVGG